LVDIYYKNIEVEPFK